MFLILAFLKDDSGATAIEYGIFATSISIAIIEVVNHLGPKLYLTGLTLFAYLNPFGAIVRD
jgi:pilus assembly protein Flp/PilA